MGFQMGGETVEGRVDRSFVRDLRGPAGEARQPSGALAVVGEEAVDIRADHAAIRRHGAFRRPIGEAGEGSRAVGSLGHAHMHLVA